MEQRNRGELLDDMLDDDDEDTQANKYLCFRIDTESYGIEIRHVIEIVEVQRISEVPDLPPYVKGVINLRGKVIPVVDLRLRFGMSERVYDDRTCIVVSEIEGVTLGFLVDTVEEVLEIPESQVEPAPCFKSVSGQERYIAGMGKVGTAVKILLDVEKLVMDEDVRSVSAVTETAR
ncbi:MAG: chemotaxis protein CheW [Treponema sp. GWB1_62_6]|nr:MAG: chemotaxis protein CheW [Treponema sp. GWB1_62_6]OHE69885.1 MAG: chemotaxis protein CheW [Treponema sp. RIFOXYC1_FULL_61_9]OHE70033.1 MAG: chemotaxis protein CheW [Treponema sp. GWC1_61_84]HCM25411.1 chemotaxis protein CheW [Treponema sp.]